MNGCQDIIVAMIYLEQHKSPHEHTKHQTNKTEFKKFFTIRK